MAKEIDTVAQAIESAKSDQAWCERIHVDGMHTKECKTARAFIRVVAERDLMKMGCSVRDRNIEQLESRIAELYERI